MVNLTIDLREESLKQIYWPICQFWYQISGLLAMVNLTIGLREASLNKCTNQSVNIDILYMNINLR